LGGGIPGALWNSTALVELDLSENGFTGTSPAGIGNMLELAELDASDNAMSGLIPDEFLNLSSPPGSLTDLSLTSTGCFQTPNGTLQTFLNTLDPEWTTVAFRRSRFSMQGVTDV
jgi:hypothetical protein